MFGRQWFPQFSQLGLKEAFVEFEYFLVIKDYQKAAYLLTQHNEFPSYYRKRLMRRLLHLEKRYEAWRVSKVQSPIKIHFDGFMSFRGRSGWQ